MLWITPQKWTNLIIFGVQNHEKISHKIIGNSPTSPACRTTLWKTIHLMLLAGQLTNIRNKSTDSCLSHPLITGKTIINSVNWTLQTTHTVDRGDMDSYFVMYQWSKTLYHNNLYTANIAAFAFHKVVRRLYSGEAGEFPIIWCDIFSWFCTPKIIKIGLFSRSYSKYNKGGVFWDTVYMLSFNHTTVYHFLN